jgi:phage tail-like protein
MPLATNFNFRIKLLKAAAAASGQLGVGGQTEQGDESDQLGDGGFQECTGLQIELDVAELLEGGRNDGVIRRVGRAKYSPITLKRGMFFGDDDGQLQAELWQWLQGIASGVRPVARYDGIIEVLDNSGASDGGDEVVVATWTFDRGLPTKIAGPQLNAKTGDVAIEELTIAHEGLRLEIG